MMEVPEKLYDSLVCRLCAEENTNGSQIYVALDGGDQLGDVINRYLPLKVSNDGKYPCTLCPGCTIQLDATKSFFDLIVEGQRKLQTLLSQQDVKSLDKMGQEQLECALKLVNPNSSVQTYSVQTDENGEKIFIQILSDGPLFPSDHDLSLKLNAEKPRKKRGRPPKPPASEEISEVIKVEEPEPIIEDTGDGKPRRRIKKPSKYSDLIQGKELDKVFLEEGINDEETDLSQVFIMKQEGVHDSIIITKNDNKMSLANVTAIKKSPSKKTFDCDICGRSFINQNRLEIHKVFHKDVFYQCTKCTQTFNSKEDFVIHSVENQHEEFKLIEYVENYGQTELSTKIGKEATSVSVETTTIVANEENKCEVCDNVFESVQNLDSHHKSVHNNMRPYTCEKCNKQFATFSAFKAHLLQHSQKIHPCEQCDKVFSHPSSLVYHCETEHCNGRKFVCIKCKKCFKHKQLLLRHQLVHTSERPFVCTLCKAAFKTRANMINHMSTHTKEKKFFCTECDLCFTYKTSLNLHQRWHSGQKDYECDVCLKTFSQKGNMVEHRRIHTGEKPFSCSYCGRRFTTSSQYKLHVKRHTGERPWRCEYCSKTFLHKGTWKNHTRRHRNERPYQCSYCLRGFTEQWALKKHERFHTGEKPYSCEICSKTFADSSNLKKHTRSHLRKQNTQNIVSELLKKTDTETSIPTIASTDTTNENQVLYLTYDGNAENSQQEDTTENLFSEDLMQGASSEEISIDVQQLVDNDGNVISITTDDGQQIKVVTTMDDEQCFQGLMPDGTLIPINLSIQDGKPFAELISSTQVENLPLVQSSDLSTMELLPEESNDSEKNKIQFLNEDGQNLCFIAYGLEGNSIGENQFINLT